MTTSKELVESAIRLEETERVPFGAPLQGFWGLWNSGVKVRTSFEQPKVAAQAQLKIINDLGLDQASGFWDAMLFSEAIGCDAMIPEYGSVATVGHPIQTPDDLDKLEFPDLKNFMRFKAAKESLQYILENGGKDRFITGPVLPPFTMGAELRGVEDMIMDSLMEEDFVHDLIGKALEYMQFVTENISDWGIDGMMLCDPTASGDLISPEDYSKFALKPTRELGITVKKNGMHQLSHICGDTGDRLDMIADNGCDVFSIDRKVNIRTAIDKIGDRVALLGNVDPTGVMFSGTPDQVREDVKKCLKDGGRKGFIIGLGCDIAVGTPAENVYAMADVIRNHK